MTNESDPWVLGISASHNGAVCLLKGDEIVVAIQEDGFREESATGYSARNIHWHSIIVSTMPGYNRVTSV